MVDVALMRLAGSIDMMSFPDIRQNIADIMNGGVSKIGLDMTDVSSIDSSGIGLLIKTSTALQGRGGDLCVFGLRPGILKLFQITRLDSKLAIHASEAETMMYFSEL